MARVPKIQAVALAGWLMVGCGDGGTLHDAPDPEPEDGTLTVLWTIEKAGAGPAICDDVGGRWVRIDAIADGQGGGFTDTVPCSLGSGTVELAPGIYDVSLVLISPSNQELAEISGTDITVASSQETQRGFTFSIP